MKKVFTLVVFLLMTLASYSQCAMCKATAESGSEGVASGLNSGILYLMFLPYLLFGVIGVLIYKHRKKIAERKGA